MSISVSRRSVVLLVIVVSVGLWSVKRQLSTEVQGVYRVLLVTEVSVLHDQIDREGQDADARRDNAHDLHNVVIGCGGCWLGMEETRS